MYIVCGSAEGGGGEDSAGELRLYKPGAAWKRNAPRVFMMAVIHPIIWEPLAWHWSGRS